MPKIIWPPIKPEEFSDDFGHVIFENGTAMFEQVAFSSGAISSSCDGTVAWRLNNERLYDKNCVSWHK
jgi:hypothetical protein